MASDDQILLKRSGIAGAIPLASQLALGELALNYADARLFTKTSNGVVVDINSMPPANNIIYVSVEGDDANDGRQPGAPKRTIRAALNAIEKSNTVAIGPGTFIEKTPLILPQNVTLHGVDQRITTVKAEDPTKDIIWVSSACYVTGFAIRDHLYPAAAISYPGNVEIGTAQSAGSGANTIVLDSSVAVTGVGMDNYYREMRIRITGGTGSGQSRNIVSYNTSTFTANVDVNWIVAPDSTSEYIIDIAIPSAPSPNTRYSSYTTASPYLYNLASITADKAISSSTTSITIAYGNITLTIGTGLTINAGRRVRLKHDPNNFMVGDVVSYNSISGVLVVNVFKHQRQDNNPRTYWDVLYVCGDGMVIDGYHAGGLKSFVSAQFTQFNQGGRGVIIRNMGYAQLVSIYGICCEDAFVAESGGTASMGNCNVNFGNRGLVANGRSEVLLTANAGFTYNETKCRRDTGLIVDSLAVDILMGSNTQSVFAGIQYWNQESVGSIPTTQLIPTIGAFEHLQTLANNIVRGDTSATNYQSGVKQITTDPATTAESTIVEDNFQEILDILNNGIVGVTDAIIFNSITANTDGNNVKAYDLLRENKSYLKKEATAWLGVNYPDSVRKISSAPTIAGSGPYLVTYTYSSMNAAPTANSFYTVEGNVNDNYNGDYEIVASTATTATLLYENDPGVWDPGTQTAVPGELTQVTASYNYLKTILPYIIEGTSLPSPYQIIESQVTSGSNGTATESALATDAVDIILDIINNGPDPYLAEGARTPIGLSASAGNKTYAYDKLKANRNFIAEEVVAYINTQTPTPYNQTKCKRDLKLIVDAIAQDIKFPGIAGNSQTVFAGLQYWSQSSYSIPSGELTATLGALAQLKTQLATTSAGTATRTNTLMDVIINIVNGTTDPTTITDAIVINDSTANGGTEATGYAAIQAAKSTIKAAILSWVTTNYPTLLDDEQKIKCSRDVGYIIDSVCYDLLYNGNRQSIQSGIYYLGYKGTTYLTSYNRTKCERDVGYIVDCLSFDLKYGGNKQSIQAGVYYYGYTNESVVGYEIPQTIDAYNKIKELSAYVIESTAVPVTYQAANNQVFSASIGSVNETNYANSLITLITNIIENGPSVAPPLRPIDLTQNTDSNTANAAALLIDNRAFIQDEVISYMNAIYGANNQTGFTIKVSSVAANVDPKINIIASTKPYVGMVMHIEGETTLDIQNGPGYAIGDTINIAHVDAAFTDYMIGTITEWDPAAESATVTITDAVGTLGNIHATWETNKIAYDRAKCERDTGLIVDAIAQDLLFTGNTQSTFSGLQYWTQSGLTIPALQLANTVAAIEAARDAALTYIVTVPEQTKVQNEFNLILDILNGIEPLATITDAIIPNSIIASTNADVLAAKAALQTNLAAIKAAAVAVDPTLSGTTLTKCERDVGYIVNSICNDLVYGGNRQAIQSGVYYYTYTSTSAVPTEIPQIDEAYQHIKELATYIIQGWNVPFNWQNVQTQDKNSAGGVGTSALVTEASGLIDLIISIISDRTIGVPNKAPLPLTPSAVAARQYAAKQLYYNRDFIIAEVIAYMDRNYRGRFTQEIVLINSGTLVIDTVDTSLVIPKYRTVLAANTIGDITTLELDERIITPLERGKTVRFYQKSTLSASGQTFEFVGSGTNVTTSLPRFGGDIIQDSEVVSSNGGIVYFTSTDQFGNFRIGEDLVINFNTGTLSGRTFTKSLYAQITPFVLALSNDL